MEKSFTTLSALNCQAQGPGSRSGSWSMSYSGQSLDSRIKIQRPNYKNKDLERHYNYFKFSICVCMNNLINVFLSKVSGIIRRQQNILEIRGQCVYTCLLISFMSLDQFKNHYLEVNYHKMSQNTVFDLWMSVFIIENIGRYVVVP